MKTWINKVYLQDHLYKKSWKLLQELLQDHNLMESMKSYQEKWYKLNTFELLVGRDSDAGIGGGVKGISDLPLEFCVDGAGAGG